MDWSDLMKRSEGLLILVLVGFPVLGAGQEVNPKPSTPNSSSPTGTPAGDRQAKEPPAAAAVQTAAGDTATDKDAAHYIIGPEDNLQITVWKEPTLSGSFPVRPDGMISLVLVGDLPAAGRTPMQLGQDITAKLKKYLQDPSVSVVVLAVNSQRIYLMGEVGHVGPIPLAAGMSPLQAIAAAGGLTPFANSKKIYILRGEAGKQQKIAFNYKQALKGDNSQSVKLQPGDTIVVP
jgi:polysaccharide biosynthesis/export protein